MLSLNLLSPDQKLNSTLQWNYIIIKNVTLMILLVTFVLSFVLFAAKVVLLTKLLEAEAQVALVDSSRSGTNKSISDINKKLDYIKTAQESFIPWSTPAWHFFQIIPEGIVINNTSINTSETTIRLDGVADTRDDLLKFKTELEKTSFIKSLYLPLNSLLQKVDIKFTMTINMNLEQIGLYK